MTADGSTLSEVLDSLEGDHPGIRARILDDSGALRRFVNVYVGDDDVRFIGGLDARWLRGPRSHHSGRCGRGRKLAWSGVGH